jgi:cytidylate kinase
VKIYLDADVESRARRRYRELQERGIAVPLEDVRAEVDRRDRRDRERADSPLAVPPDAKIIDTTGLDIDQQIRAVLDIVQRHPSFPGVGRNPG